MSVAMRTVTSNAWPTAVLLGPSTVTVGCGGGPDGAAGGRAGVAVVVVVTVGTGAAEGTTTGCETDGRGPTVGSPGPPLTSPPAEEAVGAELAKVPSADLGAAGGGVC